MDMSQVNKCILSKSK